MRLSVGTGDHAPPLCRKIKGAPLGEANPVTHTSSVTLDHTLVSSPGTPVPMRDQTRPSQCRSVACGSSVVFPPTIHASSGAGAETLVRFELETVADIVDQDVPSKCASSDRKSTRLN